MRRLKRTALFAAMLLGGVALWIGVPVGVLWGLGEILDDKSEHLVFGLVAVPMFMTLCGFLLVRLNRGYLALDAGPGDPRSPLEPIVGACAVLAVLAFLVWLVAGSQGTAPLW